MIYEIKSRQNEKIKKVVKLIDESRKNKASEFFVCEGFHLLQMALAKNCVYEIYSLDKLSKYQINENINQYIVTPEILAKLSSMKNPQGVVFICKCLKSEKIKNDKVLYLDGVNDPGNVGTLLRTALAFGYKDVIISKDSCSIYNEKVISASQGALFNLNIIYGDDNLLKSLANEYDILATEIKGSISLDKVKINNKFILVLGNESHGVSSSILAMAKQRIRIDINEIESLNVAIAGAIAMYFLR